jgi:hypothetical protein
LTIDVASELDQQARFCEAMGSPFVGRFIRAASEDYATAVPVRDLLDEIIALSRPGLRLSGAFHYLALEGDAALGKHFPSVGGDGDARNAWAEARSILDREPELVARLCRENVQTNETLRSTPILGAFLHLAAAYDRPFRLFEIGASAGLNCRFDRYRYEGPDWRWGDSRSPLVLRNRSISGRPQHLDAKIDVVERRACDAHPIDIDDARAVRRLESFVWPDQLDRLRRLRAALELAARTPVAVDAERFSTWLVREVRPQVGCVTVIVQTVVEEHLAPETLQELDDAIASVGRRASSTAPLAYVRMEHRNDAYDTSIRVLPERDAVTICRSDGHAQDIRWLGGEARAQ